MIMTMKRTYINPIIELDMMNVEYGFALSENANMNFGIDDWEDGNEYAGDAK